MIFRFINLKIVIMSINFDRSKGKAINDNRTFKVKVVYDQDPYEDDGIHYYPVWRPMYDQNKRKKQIRSYQRRMYKTWKHNRKTQWKF